MNARVAANDAPVPASAPSYGAPGEPASIDAMLSDAVRSLDRKAL